MIVVHNMSSGVWNCAEQSGKACDASPALARKRGRLLNVIGAESRGSDRQLEDVFWRNHLST
jgi:hypothetical protein